MGSGPVIDYALQGENKDAEGLKRKNVMSVWSQLSQSYVVKSIFLLEVLLLTVGGALGTLDSVPTPVMLAPLGMVYFLMAVLLLHERRSRSFQVAAAGLFVATASMLLPWDLLGAVPSTVTSLGVEAWDRLMFLLAGTATTLAAFLHAGSLLLPQRERELTYSGATTGPVCRFTAGEESN